jgi:hypothetical protein
MGATLERSPARPDVSVAAILSRIVDLREQIEAKAAETKPLAKELEDLESLAVEQMGMHGIKTLGVDGGTFTVRSDIQCNVLAANRPALIKVAEQLGIDGVVTVQTGTIKAYIKEQLKSLGDDLDAEGEAMPSIDTRERLRQMMPELAGLVSIHEKTSLVFRKR